MKIFENIVVILLVIILGIQIYAMFIRTRENIDKGYLQYQALEPYDECGADGVCLSPGGLASGMGEGA